MLVRATDGAASSPSGLRSARARLEIVRHSSGWRASCSGSPEGLPDLLLSAWNLELIRDANCPPASAACCAAPTGSRSTIA